MVADLLHQHNDPGRRVVELAVAPDETDDVHDGREVLGQLGEVHLLQLIDEALQRRQVHVDVLCLCPGCEMVMNRKRKGVCIF